jgi:tRNA threonylcarbamoyladenosine biosynthesis protein TsaE
MKQEFFLPSLEETLRIGARISTQLKAGDIVKVTGPLGAGKTALVRGIVQGLGGDSDLVHSPTFTIVHEIQTPSFLVNHCDFYRLGGDPDLEDFGGLEFFSTEKLHLIEWPEKIRLWKSITSNRVFSVDLRYDAMGRSLSVDGFEKILD